MKPSSGSDIYPELVESFITEGLLMKDFKHKHVLGIKSLVLYDIATRNMKDVW